MIKWLKQLFSKWFGKKDYEPIVLQPSPDPVPVHEDERDFYHPAVITHALKIVGMWANRVTFAGDVRDWPEGSEAGCHGECHMVVNRHDNWVGGKFDHVRNGTFERDFKNVANGYGVWASIRPYKGEIVGIIFISYDHKKRTNITFAKWR